MNNLSTRKDIYRLVCAFYAKIRVNHKLGPIFNHHIANEEWPNHLEKLTDFWTLNLLGEGKFKGSPTAKHIKVDDTFNHKITPEHFGEWLQLWIATLDELCSGTRVEKAKQLARKMATGQYLAIWNHRPENKQPTSIDLKQ